jgi:Aspartyl/Asparaginyl beta-hydroxylase
MQSEEEKFVISTLETQFNRVVFPESECPTYHLHLVTQNGNVSDYTWTPKAGMQAGLKGHATAVIELRVDGLVKLLPKLVSNEYNAQQLMNEGVVRLGGIGRDLFALEDLWGTDKVIASRNAARAQSSVSTQARRRIAAGWRAKVEAGGNSMGRVAKMIDAWAEHRVSNCILDMWTAIDIEGLNNRPWHDPSEVRFDARFQAVHQDLRKEAEALADGTVFAPHYGVSETAPDEPALFKPRGWRHYNLIQNFERLPHRCERFPIAAKLVDDLARDYAIIQSGFLIMEPGTALGLHSDAANWCMNYHYGLIVPEKCYQVVAGEMRVHGEGRSMLFEDAFVHMAANESTSTRVLFNVVLANPQLTKEEVRAIRMLATELPLGTLVFPS